MQNFPVTSQKKASLVVDILNDPRHAPVPQLQGHLLAGQIRQAALDPGPGVNPFVTSVHDRRQLVVIHDQSRQITGRRDGDEWYTIFSYSFKPTIPQNFVS